MNKFSTNLKFLLIGFLILLPAGAVSLLDQGGVVQRELNSGPNGFYQAQIAKNIGDAVTVRVIENIEVLKRNEVRLSRDVTADGGFELDIGMTMTSTQTPADNDIAQQIQSINLPASLNKRNDSRINVDNNELFTTLITALVVKVDPQNGNMEIEGTRQVVVEGQTKSLYVRGLVNPKDVDSNNEIPSYKIANAQIQIIGTGELDKDRDSGLIYKIFKFLL